MESKLAHIEFLTFFIKGRSRRESKSATHAMFLSALILIIFSLAPQKKTRRTRSARAAGGQDGTTKLKRIAFTVIICSAKILYRIQEDGEFVKPVTSKSLKGALKIPTYLVLQAMTIQKEEHTVERIVEAANKAAAIRFVAEDTITAEVATIDDAMRLAKNGVQIERVA